MNRCDEIAHLTDGTVAARPLCLVEGRAKDIGMSIPDHDRQPYALQTAKVIHIISDERNL